MTLIYLVLLVIINIAHGFIIPTINVIRSIDEDPIIKDPPGPCQILLHEEIEKYMEEMKNKPLISGSVTNEPTNLDDFSLDVNIPLLYKVKWDYSNWKIRGLRYFFFMKLKLLDDLKFEYVIEWPFVRDQRHYSCNGSIFNMTGEWSPVFGNGTFDNVYVELKMRGIGRLDINDDYLQISNFSSYFTASECIMKTTGYRGDPEESDIIDEDINRNCATVLIYMKDLLNDTMSPVISNLYNQRLRNDKIKEIVNNYKTCREDLVDQCENILNINIL